MYQAIVFLPLVGFLIAGLFGRLIGSRPSEVVTTALLFLSCALSWIAFVDVGFGTGRRRASSSGSGSPPATWWSTGRFGSIR